MITHTHQDPRALEAALGHVIDTDPQRAVKALRAAVTYLCPSAMEVDTFSSDRMWCTTSVGHAAAVIELSNPGNLTLSVRVSQSDISDGQALFDRLVECAGVFSTVEPGPPSRAQDQEVPEQVGDLPF